MKAIQIISQDLFDKVRSRFTNLEMGDETGAVTIDPAEARFFDFDFVYEGVNLGRVSISLNDLGSLKIYYSQGITENQDTPIKKIWYGFLKEMRLFAMRRLLRFDTRDISKTNLDKNDFQHLAATQGPKEEPMNMNESRWSPKSTKKTSRAVKGKTEVIIRHNQAVDELYAGARSSPGKMKAIFVQSREGERWKSPFLYPDLGFAMAQHVDHGGAPHDPAGKAIVRMAEQIVQLSKFQKEVKTSALHDDALGITERAVGRLQELKAQMKALGKRHYYEQWMGEFQEPDETMLGELDPVTLETYKQAFTQTSFNENLASLFPLIHSIMQEANKVDLESYVEEGTCSVCHKDPCKCETTDEDVKEDTFDQFTEWAEAVEQGKLTDDQLAGLKSAMATLPGGKLELGADGGTAYQFFSGYGLDSSSLKDKLKAAADLDKEADALEIMKLWAEESYPELLVALGISGTGTAPEAPAEVPAPEAPAEVPVAEGKGNEWIQRVAEMVKSRYNAANENVGPFDGFEGIALDIKKQCQEEFGEQIAEKAEVVAKKYMEKLMREWEQRHGRPATQPIDHDGLSVDRLRELLGNVKARLEDINGPKKSEVPAYMRKEKGGDWKTSSQDLEKEKERNVSGPEGIKALKGKLGMKESEITDIRKLAGLAK